MLCHQRTNKVRSIYTLFIWLPFVKRLPFFFWHFYAQCNVHIAKAFCLQTRSPPFHSAGEIMLSICQLVCSIVFRYVLFSYSNCNSSALIILSRAGIEERKKTVDASDCLRFYCNRTDVMVYNYCSPGKSLLSFRWMSAFDGKQFTNY